MIVRHKYCQALNYICITLCKHSVVCFSDMSSNNNGYNYNNAILRSTLTIMDSARTTRCT